MKNKEEETAESEINENINENTKTKARDVEKERSIYSGIYLLTSYICGLFSYTFYS